MLSPQRIEELKKTLPAILDVKDIIRILRVSRRTVYRQMACGKLKRYINPDPGTRGIYEINVLREDFIQYLSENANI